MNDLHPRLVRCFTTLFPTLRPEDVPAATPATVVEWDSVATLNLMSLIEEEFGVTADYEQLETLASFSQVFRYVEEDLRQKHA